MVIPSSVEERLEPGKTAEENATSLARQKALFVAQENPGHLVLGADTLVVLEDEIIGKPSDETEAQQILRRLSGRSHRVITGVCVVGQEVWAEATVSQVTFNLLSDPEIVEYIKTGEPMDKAGAYAIQGIGAKFVASHKGSFSNIVGLPIKTTARLLRLAGFLSA